MRDVGGQDNQGAAYVFARNQGGTGVWAQVQELAVADGVVWDHFGHSVAIAGDTVTVGAPDHPVGGTDDQGAAYVFVRDRGGVDSWGQAQELAAADGAEGDEFGSAIALSGHTILIGAPNSHIGGNDDQGSAYLFFVVVAEVYLPLIVR